LENLPLWAQAFLIILLLCFSAFFSTSETSMMSINKHRLNYLVNQGNKKAKRTQKLLSRSEDVLSTVLIGNNLINTLVTVLVTSLAVSAFGDNQAVLSITTAIVSCLIIVFCEIIPKVLGASFSEGIAFKVSGILRGMVFCIYPIIICINYLVALLFKLLGINMQTQHTLTQQEIRSMVLESSIFSPHYRNVLLNFFDLENLNIDDVMTPKSKIEGINIDQDIEDIIYQLTNCYHNKLLVYEKNIDTPLGILHIRKILPYIKKNQLDISTLRKLLSDIYYIPSHTSAIKQLQLFQDTQERIAIIVDEYGDIQGLITLEDILEQLVGEFTTSIPKINDYTQDEEGYYILDASLSLRILNRDLKTQFDVDQAKTLNGLLIEYLQDIPDSDVCLKIANTKVEITQVNECGIKNVKLKII
jgi:Mg2+/Co2+ transporter CorB